MKKNTATISETNGIAKEVLTRILSGDKGHQRTHATVLGLSGELGAGKTTFTQSLARELGITGSVSSPTFVIARFYELHGNDIFQRMIHVDAYRIESEEELRPLGWKVLLEDPTNLIVVEWPEKLGESFPPYGTRLFFDVVDETTRCIYDKKEDE